MTEITQPLIAAGGVSLPAPQGLVCFYDKDLGKDFVDGDIASVDSGVLITSKISTN